MSQRLIHKKQFGFTLVEIIVATGIFAMVISAVLVLFNYVLRINREVQAKRQVSQAARNFTEVLSREIRNGRVDYNGSGNCAASNYANNANQSLAIITYTGDRLCFYFKTDTKELMLRRDTSSTSTEESINPQNFND
ncbi:type II secretion system protein [bacterium]|nr:MAG: type II secretion system protein [bacterium]